MLRRVHARIHSTVKSDSKNGACVKPAANAFEFGDEFQRPDLRRTAHRAGRKRGAEQIECVAAFLEPAADLRDEMHDVTEPLDVHELVHADAADRADTAQVVSTEIDEHGVFGAPFRIAAQCLTRAGGPFSGSKVAARTRSRERPAPSRGRRRSFASILPATIRKS